MENKEKITGRFNNVETVLTRTGKFLRAMCPFCGLKIEETGEFAHDERISEAAEDMCTSALGEHFRKDHDGEVLDDVEYDFPVSIPETVGVRK